jgi:hypothetical protein
VRPTRQSDPTRALGAVRPRRQHHDPAASIRTVVASGFRPHRGFSCPRAPPTTSGRPYPLVVEAKPIFAFPFSLLSGMRSRPPPALLHQVVPCHTSFLCTGHHLQPPRCRSTPPCAARPPICAASEPAPPRHPLCRTIPDHRALPLTRGISVLMPRRARALRAPLDSPRHAPRSLLVEPSPHTAASRADPCRLYVP